MKRRTLHAAAGMLAAVLMLSLQGCSPMTPARTAERVAETMARTPCTAANLSGQIDISMGVAGLEVDTTVSLEESLIYSPDPQQAYMELEMGYEMMGVRVPLSMESYLLEENGKVMQYLHTGGIWLCNEVDSSMVQAGLTLEFDDPEALTFDKEVKELDGVPAVCLVGTVSGDALRPLLGNMMGELAGAGQAASDMTEDVLDFSAVSADVRMYVNKDTYLPIRMECDVLGLDTVMNDLMDGTGLSYSVDDFTMVCDYTSYEPQQIPALPAEASAAATQSERLAQGNPDNGNGTYTIREGSYYMDIVKPEGYELSDSDYDRVEFYNEELDRTVSYQMFTTIAENDLDLIEGYYEELYNEYPDLYPDTNFYDTATQPFSIMWVEYEKNGLSGSNYFAWSYLEDQVSAQSTSFPWIVVRVLDGTTKDGTVEWEDVCALLEYALPYDVAHLDGASGERDI